MLLAPTICMHRHPLGGRNFESFSEDPLLTGKLAAQYVLGLQEKGVAATVKRSSPCTDTRWASFSNEMQTLLRTNRRRTG